MNPAVAALSGEGAAAPAAAPVAAPAGAPAIAPAPPPGDGGGAWYAGIANPELKTWVEAKGFKDGATAAESAWNLEKLIGFDKAGRTIVVPKEDATPEEVKAYHSKLGVPDSPDGYKLPVPEGQDPAFAKTVATWMHKNGIPPKQAEGLATEWNGFMAEQQKAADAKAVTDADTQMAATVAKWGKEADEKIALGKRAAAAYIPAETPAERQDIMNKICLAVGTDKFLEMFAAMGANMGEHQMQDAGGGNPAMGTTVAQAQAKKAALMADPAWAKRYTGAPMSSPEWKELNRLEMIIAGVQPGQQ